MFGIANQLLAGVALAVASSAIINAGKVRFVWVTLVPMAFVLGTTLVAGWESIADNFLPLAADPATAVQGYVDVGLTSIIMIAAVVIVIEAFRRGYRVLAKGEYCVRGQVVYETEPQFSPPDYACC